MSENSDEIEVEKIRSLSQSLGKLLGQIGAYAIVQFIAIIIIAILAFGMIFSMFYETSISAIFNIFLNTIWTMVIASIILEVILFIFLIRLIQLLKGAAKQEIPFEDNYRRSALFFMTGIIVGIILFIVTIILVNWLLEMIWEILNKPSFDIEELEKIPSTEFISTFVEIGRTALSLGGFYYLKQNFEQLSFYMHGPSSEKITKGFKLLVNGLVVLVLGSLISLIIDLAGLLSLVGLIMTIVGYFKASDGLKNTMWSHQD